MNRKNDLRKSHEGDMAMQDQNERRRESTWRLEYWCLVDGWEGRWTRSKINVVTDVDGGGGSWMLGSDMLN